MSLIQQYKSLAILKLIRIENLIMMVITFYAIRYLLVDSLLIYRNHKFDLQLHGVYFHLLVLSTVCIAAAGYIINDYFDVKADKINRPDSVVIDTYIKRRWAMIWHFALNIIGIVIAFAVAYKTGNYKLGFIHVLAAGLLWHYSTQFKKQLLIGNVIIAVLTALIPVLVLLYDMPLLVQNYSFLLPGEPIRFPAVYTYILMYTLFAFLTSLIREIIKDMEDFKGDLETGCSTLPITWGMRTAKAIVIGLISNMVIILGMIVLRLYSKADILPSVYLVALVIFPLLYLMVLIFKAVDSKDFHRASLLVKGIMLTGILFTFIIFYISHHA